MRGGRIFGLKNAEKQPNSCKNFSQKSEQEKSRKNQEKFENPREIGLGVFGFSTKNQEEVEKIWRPIFLAVAEWGKEGKGEKILVGKIDRVAERVKNHQPRNQERFGAPRCVCIRP